MELVLTRITVVTIAALLLGGGSFVNFNKALANNSLDNLQKIKDELNNEFAKDPESPLADKLEVTINKFQDVIGELNKDPPDVEAAIGIISTIQQEIQVVIDDEGFSPKIGNNLIGDLETLKVKLSTDKPEVKMISVCHMPPENPENAHVIEISESALDDHLAHGDIKGDECPIGGEAESMEKKVLICHMPPGNPANSKVIEVSENSLVSHLGHGDILGGACPSNDDEADKLRNKIKEEKNSKEMAFKKKQKELKNEIKKLGKLKENLKTNADDFKEKIKEMKSEIKELLKELREDHAYELELKKELKHDIKIIKHKIEKEDSENTKILKQNIDSKLSLLSKSSTPKQDAKKLGLDFKNGKTKVAVKLSDLDDNSIERLEKFGKITSKNNDQIQMVVDLDNISKIRSINGIENIRPPFSAIQFDQQISEGVYFINADLVQYAGITGKEIKVAVLDLAFTDNEKISDNIVEVKSFREGLDYVPLQGLGDEAEHGTAVAEIITDVAPDVQLYLYAMETDIEFGLAVDEAISKGVDVIAMSAGWPHFPTDGTSHITEKIEKAIENDIAFIVPAGNFGNKHWEGSYSDPNLNGWHEFSVSDEGLSINVTSKRIAEEKPITAYLMWDVGMSDIADFELVLVDPLGQIVDYSANQQKTKSDIPFEHIHHIPDTEGVYAIGVVFSGETSSPADIPTAELEIFTPSDELEYPVAIGSVSVPADAEGAIVVGAVNHLNGKLEPFSSQGPTNNGKLAPHIVGPDGVTTVALDGNPFYGTSATAPYIAGLVALSLEANPNATPQELLLEIQKNAGPDFVSLQNEYDYGLGYGKADASFLMQTQEDEI